MISTRTRSCIAASVLLFASLQGCDNSGYAPRQEATARHPDFQDGDIAVYYISAERADVVIRGGAYKIGHGVSQAGLPFSYEWEPDGDVDIKYNGSEYEIESPYDAVDDLMEALTEKRKRKKLASGKVSAVRSKKAVPGNKSVNW